MLDRVGQKKDSEALQNLVRLNSIRTVLVVR